MAERARRRSVTARTSLVVAGALFASMLPGVTGWAQSAPARDVVLRDVGHGVSWTGSFQDAARPSEWRAYSAAGSCDHLGCGELAVGGALPADVWARPGGVQIAVNWPDEENDLDLYVYGPDGLLAGKSDGVIASSGESVRVQNAANGRYRVVVVPRVVVGPMGYQGFAEVERNTPVEPVRPLLPNLVALPARNPHLRTGVYYADHKQDGSPSCYPEEIAERGARRCLRFDQVIVNNGDGPFELRYRMEGLATDQQLRQRVYNSDGTSTDFKVDTYEFHPTHAHFHYKTFGQAILYRTRADGSLEKVREGRKNGFCMIDVENTRFGVDDRGVPYKGEAPRTYYFPRCNAPTERDEHGTYMVNGISAGWADVYSSFLACQFVVIDALPNGDYTLQSTTNAKHVAGEECYGDNTVWTGLRINGNVVTVIDPPFIPADCIRFNRANVAAVNVGGRWKVVEGGTHWMLDTGSSQWEAQRAVEIINHYKLASMCFVGRPRCGPVNPMMYWLNDAGRAPSGQLPGEDCIPFDRDHLSVVEIGGRWKVVEGTHWLLDFGVGEGNARAALHFIRKHRFDQICFVGRPDPSMTYFKTNPRRPPVIDWLDPRRIEAAIESPTWWREHLRLVADRAPALDLSTEHAGTGPAAREIDGFVVDVQRGRESAIVELGGITGLALTGEVVIHLPKPADVVDIGIAHDGKPPVVAAYAGGRGLAKASTGPVPRQIENLRLVGSSIDRLVITSEGEAILNYIRTEPRESGRVKKAGGRERQQTNDHDH